jgi:hypothetical protein
MADEPDRAMTPDELRLALRVTGLPDRRHLDVPTMCPQANGPHRCEPF